MLEYVDVDGMYIDISLHPVVHCLVKVVFRTY